MPEKNWSTNDEIKHLEGLGSWGERKRPRLQLLRNYYETMYLRKRWGYIDREFVGAYVQKLTREEIQ